MLELNQVYLGDCLEVMKSIDDELIDLILCDLPYGITDCEWDKRIPFEPLWEQYRRILKDTGVIALTADQPFTSELVVSNLPMFKHEVIWDKVAGTNFLNLKNAPFKTHGNVEIFAKNGNFTYNPIFVKRTPASLKRHSPEAGEIVNHGDGFAEHYGKLRDRGGTVLKENGMKHPVSIVTFNLVEVGRYDYKHPTRKPVDLFEYLIRVYSNPGDTVLDNCAGIGTTGVAAYRSKRNFILIEKDEKYYETAVKRVAEAMQQRHLF
jgi:site-specific DNA-methyltransferase (adenine-specific)